MEAYFMLKHHGEWIVYQEDPLLWHTARDITQRRTAEEAMLRIRREHEQLAIARTKVIERLGA